MGTAALNVSGVAKLTHPFEARRCRCISKLGAAETHLAAGDLGRTFTR